MFLLYGRRIATHSVDPSLTHFLDEFPGLGLALIPDVVVPETEPVFLSGLSPIARILSRGNRMGSGARPGLLVGGLYSPSHLSVVGYMQDLTRVVVPSTNLLHPGREAAVGPRLLIRRDLAAGLYI